MARLEAHRTGRRTLNMVGGKSYAVTIPIEEIRNLGWEKGDQLIVRRFKDHLVVERDPSAGRP